MTFLDLPATAAWRHGNSRQGLEVCSFARRGDGWTAAGATTAAEAGAAWWVTYELDLDPTFRTRRARIAARTGTDTPSSVLIEGDGLGHWTVDGRPAAKLDGCLDVDLESSAMTNAVPMRRLALAVGDSASAPAVYVRVHGLAVERLEQRYDRRPDSLDGPVYGYEAPAFAFGCAIDYDPSGLVVNYPGIAERTG